MPKTEAVYFTCGTYSTVPVLSDEVRSGKEQTLVTCEETTR